MTRMDRTPVTLAAALAATLALSAPALGAATDVDEPLVPVWEGGTALNVAVDPQGHVWVSTPQSTFDIYDRDGRLLETWGEHGRAEGQFDFEDPWGQRGDVAFRPDGGFYVSDPDNARIQEFDAERRFVRSFGSYGEGTDQFVLPDSIAVDEAGHVYVIDVGGAPARVLQFAPQGDHVRNVPAGPAMGPFFALDPDGTVYGFDEVALALQRIGADGSIQTVADLAGRISFGTGILPLPSGGYLVASELSGDSVTGPEHLVMVGADGEVAKVWPNGGWGMALDPGGDRFYLVGEGSRLQAYDVPAS